MKVSLFNGMPYGPVRSLWENWPPPNELFEPEQALKAADHCLEQAQLADEVGFDWISCAEHHFSPGSLSPNATVLAAALSQRVRRARLAILGALIPLANPVRVAEEYAMIDTLTGGRLIAGLMRGAPYEYLVYSIDPAESRSRFEEAWELILKAWTESRPFGWDGEHYHFRTVSIWPRPIQQPHPPIFVSGSSRDSGQFAARKRVGLGLAFTTVPNAAGAARYYRECAAEEGWEPTPDQIVYQAPIYVSDTDEKAFAELQPHLEYQSATMARNLAATRMAAGAGFFGARDAEINARFQNIVAERRQSLEGQIELGQIFCGGPDSVATQIRRLHTEVGAGVVNLIFQIGSLPHDQTIRSLELFAREVLPQVHEL